MEWEPAKSDDVVNVAWPETRLLVASGVVPSLKVTVPVGVPLPGATALTVAVNVTELLTTEGLSDEVTVFVVLALLTVMTGLVSVLELSATSVAVTVLVPTALRATLNVLVPATNAAFPGNVAAPSVEVICT